MMTTEEMNKYDMIVELGIATAEELNLAFDMTNMNWNETLDSVVYIREGYRTFEEYMEVIMEEE